MKPALILMLFLASVAMLRAQIINGDFEDWTNGHPDGWVGGSDNSNSISGIHSLLYNSYGASEHPQTIVNNKGRNLESSGRGYLRGGCRALTGMYKISLWYKYEIIGDYPLAEDWVDIGVLVVASRKDSTIFLHGPLFDSTSAWRKEIIAYLPFTDSATDSIAISFFIYGSDHYPKTTLLFLDDIALEINQVSVDRSENSNNTTLSISPNPISSHAHLNLHLDGTASIRAAIYDVTGREVLHLPELASASGDESIPFDVDGIPNGMYYVRCEVGGNITMEKIIVQH